MKSSLSLWKSNSSFTGQRGPVGGEGRDRKVEQRNSFSKSRQRSGGMAAMRQSRRAVAAARLFWSGRWGHVRAENTISTPSLALAGCDWISLPRSQQEQNDKVYGYNILHNNILRLCALLVDDVRRCKSWLLHLNPAAAPTRSR